MILAREEVSSGFTPSLPGGCSSWVLRFGIAEEFRGAGVVRCARAIRRLQKAADQPTRVSGGKWK
jgi:hypothetical protein